MITDHTYYTCSTYYKCFMSYTNLWTGIVYYDRMNWKEHLANILYIMTESSKLKKATKYTELSKQILTLSKKQTKNKKQSFMTIRGFINILLLMQNITQNCIITHTVQRYTCLLETIIKQAVYNNNKSITQSKAQHAKQLECITVNVLNSMITGHNMSYNHANQGATASSCTIT